MALRRLEDEGVYKEILDDGLGPEGVQVPKVSKFLLKVIKYLLEMKLMRFNWFPIHDYWGE